MADVLVDTDVLIDHLRIGRPFHEAGSSIWYSVLTRAELLAGRSTEEPLVQRLLRPLSELPVDRRVGEAAGRIRRGTGLPLPDAVIAATALVHDLPLLTRNGRDFERVPRLRLAGQT